MSVSQRPVASSIDVSDLRSGWWRRSCGFPVVRRRQFGPDRSAEGFEKAERQARKSVNALGCKLLGALVEERDDRALQNERNERSWFHVAATPRTIMAAPGSMIDQRAGYRNGASRLSLTSVNESLGLADD